MASTSCPGPLLLALRQRTPRNGLDTPFKTHREMVEYRSEFPARFRTAIQTSTDEPSSRKFCFTMCQLLWDTLVWKATPEKANHPPQENADDAERPRMVERPWGGFDTAIDTEEEIEVIVRIFPGLLCSKPKLPNPMDVAMESTKTIPFVPVLAAVLSDVSQKRQRVGAQWAPINATDFYISKFVRDLVTNRIPRSGRNVEKASTLALVRLKEKGLMTKDDVAKMIDDIVKEEISWNIDRLRVLIEWSPAALKASDDYFNSLFQLYLHRHSYTGFESMRENIPYAIEVFELFFEAGMTHYPKQMGFLFNTDAGWYKNSIEMACDICGGEAIFGMVHRVLSSRAVLGNPDAFRATIRAVATNQKILLDALYLLVRTDPIAACAAFQPPPETVTTTTTTTTTTTAMGDSREPPNKKARISR